MNDEMVPPRREELLDEYAVSLEYAKHHAGIIWQTASIFLNLSLVGIAYFAGTRVQDIESLVGRVIVATGSIAMLLAWYFFFKRWNSYLAVGFCRMEEIEGILKNLWLVRSAHFLRAWKLGEGVDESDPETKERYDDLRKHKRLKDFYPHPQHRTAKYIVTLLISGWIALIILDAISVFS